VTAESEPPSPFGRYFAPRWQRAGRIFSTLIPGVPLILNLSINHGDIPAWFIGTLIFLIALGVIAAIVEWFFPLTTIDETGIRRRRPTSHRRIGWGDVFDARFGSSWGTSYVLLLLRNNEQVKLYGVGEAAVEGIRRIAAGNPAHPAQLHPSGPMASGIHPG
jgi:Bacterial PH domain